MLDAIKSLNPKQRFFAFLFAIILTSITSISTAYLKTAPCEDISNQYTQLMKNQETLMAINNQWSKKYDSEALQLSNCQYYSDSLDSINKVLVHKLHSMSYFYQSLPLKIMNKESIKIETKEISKDTIKTFIIPEPLKIKDRDSCKINQ